MLKRLQIRNFRGFNALEIDQLSGINLIAGKNNSGKTSLLEAVFLLAGGGNAQMAANTNVIRGLEPNGAPVSDPFWKQLFFNLDMERPIEIEVEHTHHGQLALCISLEQQTATNVSLDRADGISATNLFDERALIFQYSEPSGERVENHIRRKREQFEFSQLAKNPPFPAAILLSRTRNIHEDSLRLGILRRYKQGHLLLKALQVIEPKLQSIEENSSSGTPMIWGDIGLSELVPLPAMGEGMTQIARLVLAIASMPNGVVLVDEVENGIHHSVLPDVWRAIDEAAKQFRTQIFATTHSFECIEAAHQALGPDGFLLHRLEASDAENRCVTFKPNGISAALRHNLEVR